MVAGTAVLVFGAAWTAQSGWMVIVAAALIGVLGASFGPARRGVTSVRVERSVPAVAAVGEEIEVVVAAENLRRRTALLVEIEDRLLGSHPAWIPALAGGGRARYRYRETCARRGKYRSAPVTIRCGAPFGLVRAERTCPTAAELTVFPRVVPLGPLAFGGASDRGGRSTRPLRRATAGEPVGVREYLPGDPRRAVHWRLSARSGRLAIREFKDEAGSMVALAVAAGPVPGTAGDRDRAFELMISAVASIGVRALDEGRRLRAAYGDKPCLDGPDRRTLLDWLAGLEAGAEPHLLGAARQILAGGAIESDTIVVFGLGDDHSLEEVAAACGAVNAAGSSPVAVIALDAAAERSALSGVPTYAIDPEKPLDQCLSSCLSA